MEKQLVIFELGPKNYGVDVESVVRVGAIPETLQKPPAPSYIEGQFTLFGRRMPVVDLHKWFGFYGHDRTEDSRILVANLNGTKIGMIVSAVTDVVFVDESEIELLTNINLDYVLGTAKINERLVTLVDLGRVLTVEEKKQLELFQVEA